MWLPRYKEQGVVSPSGSPPSQGGVPEGGGGYKNLATMGLCEFLSSLSVHSIYYDSCLEVL
ncbi:MAG TPA: hypothetical protein VKY45_14120 [Marinilabiliaceae bacterium]|nr:hypothetical protein [Marinilabiliaceae bacterium]